MNQQTIRLYEPWGGERRELCHPVDSDDFETIIVLNNGTPRQATWQPVAMQLHQTDERGRKYRRSDSPGLGSHALIFRPTVIQAMGDLLRAHGELLPLRCEDHELWLFNPRQLDAFDEEASTLERFSSGRVMWIDQYVFRPEVARGVHAFKIPQLRASPSFVSQQFVDQWNDAGLEGLEFTLLWEHPG